MSTRIKDAGVLFAIREDTFLYCRVHKGVGGGGQRGQKGSGCFQVDQIPGDWRGNGRSPGS